MSSGLSLKVLLQLQKKGFESGIKSVENGLKSLKNMVTGLASAFIGGLGLNHMVSAFKDTAVKLSQVENTLKNVSDSITEYEDTLHYLKNIANEFGVEQNALIQSFAKFHSAAKTSNLTMEQQKDIFTSLTRAAGAFHLSSDETAHALLAVEQMLSKGKVSAEELRRQLGNSLPGAFNIMALAAGDAGITLNGTTAELDAAMRSGKVISEEILPFFAKRLNEVTKNASFDSLQSSLNRFQNSWTEFVRNSQFTDFYKSLVDGGTNALNYLGKNFNSFKKLVVDAAASIAGAFAFKKLGKEGEKELERINAAGKNIITDTIPRLNKELDNLEAQLMQIGNVPSGQKVTVSLSSAEAAALGLKKELVDTLKFLEMDGKTVHDLSMDSDEAFSLTEKRISATNIQLRKANQELERLGRDGVKHTGFLSRSMLGLKTMIKGVGAALKAAFSQILVIAVITAVTHLIQKLVELRKEAKRIANIPKEAIKNAQQLSEETSKLLGQMDAQVSILNYSGSTEEERIKALRTINSLLGLEGEQMFTLESSTKDIAQATEEWKNQTKELAKESQRVQELEKVSARINDLNEKLQEIKTNPNYGKTEQTWNDMAGWVETVTAEARKLYREENKINKELNKQIEARQALLDLAVSGPGAGYSGGGVGGGSRGGDNEAINAVRKELDAYKKAVNDLNNKKANGALTEKQYQKELIDTQKRVMGSISVYHDLDGIIQQLGGDYKTLFEQIRNGSKKSTGGGGGAEKNPVKEAMDKYIETEKTLDNLLKNGIINQYEYNERLIEAAEACEEVVGAQDDMSDSLKKLGGDYEMLFGLMRLSKDIARDENKSTDDTIKSIKKLDEQMEDTAKKREKYQKEIEKLGSIPVFKPNRDTSFDYKKDESEILDANADKLEKYIKDLEDYKEKLLDVKKEHGYLTAAEQQTLEVLEDLISKATKGATTARVKATIAEIDEDIKEMQRDLNDMHWDVITDGISGFEGLISSIESCINAFEKLDESDATWIDHLKAGFSVLNTIIDLIESIKTVTETLTMIQELSGKLQEAQAQRQIAMSQIKTQTLAKEGETAMAVAAEKATAAGIEIAADEAKASAAGKAAASQAAESVAGVPYVGPILAVAAIASVVGALLSSFQKFASGGFVGGSKTQGDQNVIRANSGELILNKRQQGNLFSMIKNGGVGGSSVDFRIRGADLVGVMRNYDSRLNGGSR